MHILCFLTAYSFRSTFCLLESFMLMHIAFFLVSMNNSYLGIRVEVDMCIIQGKDI